MGEPRRYFASSDNILYCGLQTRNRTDCVKMREVSNKSILSLGIAFCRFVD